jgi:uncharacterized repeat protein (TIGR03803 family)
MVLGASFRYMAILLVFFAALGIGLVATPSARATTYTAFVLHSFGVTPGDGQNPAAPLISDSNGNLYSTTPSGGASGFGTVFELVNSSGTYTEKVLYSFSGGADGGSPSGGLVMDAAGNLYGTTLGGGASGLGTVFELVSSSGTYTETVLHSFVGGSDGQVPNGGLVRDASGNLYGVTVNRQASDNGAVFELVNSSGTYTEKVVYNFTGGSNGGPIGPLAIDASGNLYGAAQASPGRFGTPPFVFKLVNSAGAFSEKILYAFNTSSIPINGGLLLDASGNVYGTTGGDGAFNFGSVFKLVNSSGNYTETNLYNFTGGADGGGPNGGLIKDAAGNLYGTNASVAFELVNSSGAYTITILHTFLFGCTNDGSNPQAGLLMGPSGQLYGTTAGGGANSSGTVFELVQFTGQPFNTTTTLTSSLNPANAGDQVTLYANVTPSSNLAAVISGTVTISNGSVVISSSPLSCGNIQPTVEDASSLGIGPNTLTATFTPDTPVFAASSGTLNQTINEPGAVVTNGNNTLTGNQTINGTVSATSLVGGSLDVGGGTPITEYVSITQGITVPALNSLTCAQFTTAAVTGFTPGASDTIALGVPRSLLTGLGDQVFLVYQAWETSATASPTITIQVCNPSGYRYQGGGSGKVRVSIFKH